MRCRNTKTTGGHIQFDDGHYELFDLGKDPFESTNLAKSKPKKLRQMMAKPDRRVESTRRCLSRSMTRETELRPQLP